MEIYKTRFLRAVEGCKIVDYKCNENIKELGVADIRTTIKKQHKWIEHLKKCLKPNVTAALSI
jgi:hypothetical protein